MFASVHNMSMSLKTGLMSIAGYLLFGAAITTITFVVLDTALMNQAQQRMSMNIGVAKGLLGKYGDSFSLRDGQLFIGDHVLNDDNATPDQITKLVGGVATIFMGDKRVATNIIDKNGKRAVGTKLAQGKAYDAVMNGKSYLGEADILGDKYLTAYDPILNSSGEVIGIVFVGMKKSEQLALIEILIGRIAITTVVISLLMSLLTYSRLRRQLRPLEKLNDVIVRLQKDDVSVEIPALNRGDEIGKIARGMQNFKEGILEKLRLRKEQEDQKRMAEEDRKAVLHKMADDFERSVKGVVATVSTAAYEMQTNAQSMSAIAEQTSKQSSVVSGAAEQSSSNIQTVASAAEELNSSIGEINRQITDSVRVASECVSEAESTSAVMQTLSKSAEDIGNVVKLIEGIASQVNLLALNATIEAARAGESGRGFAVVANEVKNLANQVAIAAQDITRQIGGIQGQTSQAVETINSITGTIKRLNEISTAIAAAVEEQGVATKEISRSIQETAEGTSEVTRNIAGVTRAASETGKASSQVLDTADQLAKESEVLQRVVENFIAKVREG
ncbi:MAG: cache domain-containing protein [Alphaproteobacteria bacterium]|nr:cache domain-containing protein [Alphaproteobacteria bacterium]